jgi:hypothetical protein
MQPGYFLVSISHKGHKVILKILSGLSGFVEYPFQVNLGITGTYGPFKSLTVHSCYFVPYYSKTA